MSIIYYNFLNIFFGKGSFIYSLSVIEHESSTKLAIDHSWTDDYFLWCEYISKKSLGENITLEKIKQDYFKEWHEIIKKTTEEMNKRDMSGMID
jgi:hypothetical protein